MSQTGREMFRVECPECSVVHEASTFTKSEDFAEEHQTHTDHKMEWADAPFADFVEAKSNWELECETCDTRWQFHTLENAADFREDHAVYTDHTIEDDPEEVISTLRVGGLSRASVKNLLGELADHFTDGVPEKAVYAHFYEDGSQIFEVKAVVEELKQMGEVEAPYPSNLQLAD